MQKVTQSLGVSKRPVRSANPDRVGVDDDRYRLPVAGDGHFLAREHTVEDL